MKLYKFLLLSTVALLGPMAFGFALGKHSSDLWWQERYDILKAEEEASSERESLLNEALEQTKKVRELQVDCIRTDAKTFAAKRCQQRGKELLQKYWPEDLKEQQK